MPLTEQRHAKNKEDQNQLPQDDYPFLDLSIVDASEVRKVWLYLYNVGHSWATVQSYFMHENVCISILLPDCF